MRVALVILGLVCALASCGRPQAASSPEDTPSVQPTQTWPPGFESAYCEARELLVQADPIPSRETIDRAIQLIEGAPVPRPDAGPGKPIYMGGDVLLSQLHRAWDFYSEAEELRAAGLEAAAIDTAGKAQFHIDESNKLLVSMTTNHGYPMPCGLPSASPNAKPAQPTVSSPVAPTQATGSGPTPSLPAAYEQAYCTAQALLVEADPIPTRATIDRVIRLINDAPDFRPGPWELMLVHLLAAWETYDAAEKLLAAGNESAAIEKAREARTSLDESNRWRNYMAELGYTQLCVGT